ncbi:glucodextranase DOMON-like domain-containing protein [Halothermothrix orenii]|uniref:Membrane-anchored protein predicted to be involved in regulation of amylopullulanase n=1 Tax=Halothermothrix orenii (strain H 168 / OCM 544 / DSM 9562) TaxID=373903 RepID=B8CYI3_HALOH|nr:glucodextranase DOMON-like domain-containing protein [Halothermothrix orenii]ACL70352.1 Membrane-anchored protein predicted to be involved in regulation of amylopullulanase [Halothermothrix orenii H 168]
MKKHINIIVISLLILTLIVFSIEKVQSEDVLLYEITDPAGDDYGPGNYRYPTNGDFHPFEGLFDITRFRITEKGDYYFFDFKFSKITNPWQSENGFSLPLIELYIDNQQGGDVKLFEPGANVELCPDYPWDVFLKISGFWVRAFNPSDRDKRKELQAEILSLQQLEKNPWDVNDSSLTVTGNTITLKIKRDIVGPLDKAYLYILIGGFDPFGPGHFREVVSNTASWRFSLNSSGKLDYAPRVIDVILPEGMKQEEVLGNFNNDFPVIYPLKIGGKSISWISGYKKYLIYLVFLLIIYTGVTLNKKYFSKHNKV